MIRLSVVICTWNRCKLLARTLDSLAQLTVPGDLEWELIVVNNNATDATDEVLDAFAGRLPIRRLFEPRLGLSRARNLASGNARGELVVYTDDDVTVDGRWLSAYWTSLNEWPRAQFFGGPIELAFEVPPPAWFLANQALLLPMFGYRDFGGAPRRLSASDFPYGPNMAFRRSVFALADFDERVGRCGDGHVRGSEASLFMTLNAKGVEGAWVPEAKVRHFVPADRATTEYLWQYHEGMGRTSVRLNGPPRRSGALKYWTSLGKAAASRALRRKSWIGNLIRAARVRGEMKEVRLQARRAA